VFAAFADDAEQYFGFTVLPETISSRQPPEPDILCQVADQGPVAFELVEILEQDAAELTSKMSTLREALLEHQGVLIPEDIEQLTRKFALSRVAIGFDYDKPLRELQAAIPKIYTWLIHVVDGKAPGEAVVPVVPTELRGAVRFVHLQPSPHAEIDVHFSLSLGNTPFSRVSRKLVCNRYSTDVPIELLAYSHDQPWLSDESWIATAKSTFTPLMDDSIRRGHIRRIWVYNVAERRTARAFKMVYPGFE
jgi:hypothetical protein